MSSLSGIKPTIIDSKKYFLADYFEGVSGFVEYKWMHFARVAWEEIQAAKELQTSPKGNKGKGKRSVKLTPRQKEVWELIE